MQKVLSNNSLKEIVKKTQNLTTSDLSKILWH